MKKYLIVLAAVAMAFIGCKKEEKSALTAISFKDAESVMMIGDTLRLALVPTPKEVAIPQNVVWSSSDTTVVKIVDNKGNVAAVGAGSANITAKSGDLTAVCKITADYYEAFWQPTLLYYFPSTQEEYSPEIIDIQGYKCKLYSIEFFAPNNLDFAEDLSAGEGTCLFATAVVPFIEEGEYKGEPFARAFKIVEKEDELAPFTALKGSMDPAIIGPVFQAYFESLDADPEAPAKLDADTYKLGVSGAHLANAEISDDGISYSYFFDGVLTEGFLQIAWDDNDEAYLDFDFDVNWCGGVWALGLATNWQAETYSELLIQPYDNEWAATYRYKTGQVVAEELLLEAPRRLNAARKTTKPALTIHREKPVLCKFAPIAK